MTNLIRALQADVPVEYRVFHLVGLGDPHGLGDFDEPLVPETVVARHTQVHVGSGGSDHVAAVRMEAWDGEPTHATAPSPWDYTVDLRLVSESGIALLVTLDGQLVRRLVIGPPLFRYQVRICRAGGAAARALPQFSRARGVETYLVQTWPVEDVFDPGTYLGTPASASAAGDAVRGGYEPTTAASWPSMRRAAGGTGRTVELRTAQVSTRPQPAPSDDTGQTPPADRGLRDLSGVSPEEFSRITGLPGTPRSGPARPASPRVITVRSGDPNHRTALPGVIYNILPGPREELFEAVPELARHPETFPSEFFDWPEEQRRELVERRRDDILTMDALATQAEPRWTLQRAHFPACPGELSPGATLRAWAWLHPTELEATRTGALRTEVEIGPRDALSGRVFVGAVVTVILAGAADFTVRAAVPVEAARLLAAERVRSPDL